MCIWLISSDTVRSVAVSDASPVGYRLHKHEPEADFDAVTRPVVVLSKLLRHNVLNKDINFTNSYKPKESGTDTVAHGSGTGIAVSTVVALPQFIEQTHFVVI